MDPQFITPFISSIQNVFSTMLQLPVTVNPPAIKKDRKATYDVSGIIGMSGDVSGSVILSFSKETSAKLVTVFCGAELEPDNPDFTDAVGELVNMVAGNAKGMFKDRDVSISCPSVVIGTAHTVAVTQDVPMVVIPCSTECGELTIEIAIQDHVGANAKATGASASA